MPIAVLEVQPAGEPASNGMQQASRYALHLGLRFSIASNGREYIVLALELRPEAVSGCATGRIDCAGHPDTANR